MISNFEAILDQVFGEADPDWVKVIRSAEKLESPTLNLVEVLWLMWLQQNDPEAFDEAIMNEL